MAATSKSMRVRRRKALLAALALNRGEVDARRLARVLSQLSAPAAAANHGRPG